MSYVDYRTLTKEFYRDFPDAQGNVALAVYEDGGRDLYGRIDGADKSKKAKNMLQEGRNSNCCRFENIGERTVAVVHLMAQEMDYAWSAAVTSFKENLKRPDIDEEFVAHHEWAHAIARIRGMEYKGDKSEAHFNENFVDTYAALKVIQKHGAEGVKYVQWKSDLMQLVQAGRLDGIHYTTNAMDDILQTVKKKGLTAIKNMSPAAMLTLAMQMAQKHVMSDADLQHMRSHFSAFVHESDTLLTGLPKPLRDRFNAAANRLIEVPAEMLDVSHEEAKKLNAKASGEIKFKTMSPRAHADPDADKLKKVTKLIQEYGQGMAIFVKSKKPQQMSDALRRLRDIDWLLPNKLNEQCKNYYAGNNKKLVADLKDPEMAENIARICLEGDAKVERFHRLMSQQGPGGTRG